MTERVIYGAYGSNLHRPRLLAYIEGAPEDGPFGPHRGSSDRRPPGSGDLVLLPGRLYFGGWSSRWQGGVAFVDLDEGGAFLCRPYDLSIQQLRDLVAQENGAAGDEAALPADLGITTQPCAVAGRYDLVATLRTGAGDPVRVITSRRRQDPAPPSGAYLEVIAGGLLESGTPRDEVVGYLAGATRGLVGVDDVEAAVPGGDRGDADDAGDGTGPA